jgi:predicted DNA-binding transcriptional regulator YafY
MLQDLGFEVPRDENNRYTIDLSAIAEPARFSNQEAQYIKQTILSTGKNHPLNASILSKIEPFDELKHHANLVLKAQIGLWVEIISKGLFEKKQICLEQYQSANSQTISDRIVEPICFTDNYQNLAAYELASKSCKFFNLERIGKVVLLDNPIAFEKHHEFFSPDVFGFQGKSLSKEIDIIMNLKACLILKTEYPMCNPAIEKDESVYRLKTKVQSFLAPTRFVMGMKDDVQVNGSVDFIAFIKKQST